MTPFDFFSDQFSAFNVFILLFKAKSIICFEIFFSFTNLTSFLLSQLIDLYLPDNKPLASGIRPQTFSLFFLQYGMTFIIDS